MANLVNLERVTVHSGITTVLDAISLGVNTGDRIGVVGANGGGKSTLLGVLAKTRTIDAGRITHAGGLRVAAVAQDDELPPTATVREVVLGAAAEHEWSGQAGVRAVISGLLGDERAGGVG
ncbi:MAG: ATP-binding cassette domain-containing protein, partial [Nostocoides sp.]